MIEWTAVTLGMVGTVLVGKKMIAGWLCWLVGNSLWVYLGWRWRRWGLLTQFAVYVLLSLWGLYEWTRTGG